MMGKAKYKIEDGCLRKCKEEWVTPESHESNAIWDLQEELDKFRTNAEIAVFITNNFTRDKE